MPKSIKMGEWVVFPDSNKLCLDHFHDLIEPLAMDVLVYFCRHSEEVISRDELIENVWKGRVVGDHAVYRIINKLRQTLARDSSQEYIKTIRKKGYQLVCKVSFDVEENHISTEETDDNGNRDVSAGLSEPPVILPTYIEKKQKLEVTKKESSNPLRKGFIWGLGLLSVAVVGYLSLKLYAYYSMTTYKQSIPLVSLEGTIRDLSFSADGSHIAFSYKNKAKDHWDLYIESLSDGRLYQLTDDAGDELSPTWSPDGTSVAFIKYENQNCSIDLIELPKPLSALGMTNRGGTDKTSISPLKACSGILQHNTVIWGHDNKHLFYTSAKTKVSPLQVFRLTIQTGKTEQLTNYSQGETRGALSIKLAPDNQKLAILKDVNWRDSRIEVLNLDSLTFETIRDLVGWDRHFDWFSHGEAIIYNRNAKEVDAYDVAMNVEKNIIKSVEAISFPTYSPVTSEIAVVAGRKVVNIVSEELGSLPKVEDKPLTVIASSSINNYAEFANTSDDIAFVSRRTGEPQVWLKTTDGTEKQLTFFEANSDIQRIRWSPSDEFLLFIHNNTLYKLTLSKVDLSVIYEGKNGEIIEGESWAQDGNSVLFSSERDGDWQIYRLSLRAKLESKTSEPLTNKGGYAAFESPDGSGIYYLKYHTDGLWFKPYNSEVETKVINNIDIFSWNSVYVRGRSIYYLSNDFPKMAIYRFDIETNESVFVQNYQGSPWLLSISRNADKLLYQKSEQTLSTLILLKP